MTDYEIIMIFLTFCLVVIAIIDTVITHTKRK